MVQVSGLTQDLMARKKKVLIIDDEPDILSLLTVILQGGKYEVLEARAADAALDLLEHETVDLVISDIRMPGMSGIEFLGELREWDMNLPVIFITGNKDLSRAVASGVTAFIKKPFKKDTILKAVQKAFHSNGKHASQEPSLEPLEEF